MIFFSDSMRVMLLFERDSSVTLGNRSFRASDPC